MFIVMRAFEQDFSESRDGNIMPLMTINMRSSECVIYYCSVIILLVHGNRTSDALSFAEVSFNGASNALHRHKFIKTEYVISISHTDNIAIGSSLNVSSCFFWCGSRGEGSMRRLAPSTEPSVFVT